MPTIQTREVEALKSAHGLFREEVNDEAVKAKALVAATAKIFGWNFEQAKQRIQQLRWEIGLVLDRGFQLSEETFLTFATNVHELGFIPVAARPVAAGP